MEPSRARGRAPCCRADEQGKPSRPLLDRIDLAINVLAVAASDLALPSLAESSADVAARDGGMDDGSDYGGLSAAFTRWSRNRSRRVSFDTFPVAVIGNSSTITTSSGIHHLAMRGCR